MANDKNEAQLCADCSERIPFGHAVVCVPCADHSDCQVATVRAWADRQRLLHGMPSDVGDYIERMAQDIEDGFTS